MKKNISFFTVTMILLCVGVTHSFAQSYSLYAVADSGGVHGDGVLYRYDYPSGHDTVLFSFNGTNGIDPGSKILLANNGYIYGVARLGGAYGYGVIFRYDTSTGKDTVLFNFDSISDGASPPALALQASNGLIYGETRYGGTHFAGTLFSFDPATNVLTVLVNFHDTLGEDPDGFMLQASNGLIYGHCSFGGAHNDGVVFCYNINTGKDSVAINFDGTNGSTSHELMQASNGLIYGITQYGGAYDEGVLYAYNPVNGDDTIVVNFENPFGIYPTGYVCQVGNDFLYGVTGMGGTNGNGLMYRYNIATGQDTVFYNFPASGNMGEDPSGVAFIQAPGGLLYIEIGPGGAYDKGVLLTVDTVTNAVNKVLDFNGANGANPQSFLLLVPKKSSLGIDKITPQHGEVEIYPNPCNGNFTVACHSERSEESLSTIEIYNVLGEKVLSETLRFTQGDNLIDLSAQPSGVYFYRVLKEDENLVGEGKIIILK
jgi:uncharacterized repeat protein (TIGR03803 family)